MFQKLSLRAKLQSVLFGMSLVSLTLVGIESHQGTKALKSGKETQLKTASESIIDKIERNLFERYGDVQAYALSEPARSGDPARITSFINDMMSTYSPVYDMMFVVNSSGKVIAVNQVDKSGKAIPSAFMLGKDFSKEGWFKAAMSGDIKPGASFVEDLHVDSDVAKAVNGTGRVMNFTAPIRDKATGKVLGVWTNRMSWADVVDAIVKEEAAKLKSDRITAVLPYLVDSEGNFMMHPRGESVELKQALADFEAPRPGVKDSKVTLRQVEEEAFKGEAVEVRSPSLGYASYPTRGWTFILQAPASDSQVRFNAWLVAVAIAAIVAFNLFGFAVFRGVARLFEGVIENLKNEANRVGGTAETMSGASRSLAAASTQQATALQQTAASLEQTSAMIKKSSENAQRSRQAADTSHEVASRGKAMVDQMIQAIENINQSNSRIMDQVNDSNRQIGDIVKVITEIGAKTKVINDIVFQTKLLSFNASVEAARAGEHGKGFAVVAEEVGNLAQMSGNAAKEISEMLEGSVSKVESIVSETRSRVEGLIADGRNKVQAGREVANRCGDSLNEVVRFVGEVREMVNEISVASQEQAQGVGEINKAMGQLDQATHANAQTSQEASQSANALSSQAETLLEVVDTLEHAVQGAQVAKVA